MTISFWLFIFSAGKSSVLLDVKPWDDETDMKKLEEAVRSVEMEGLFWGACKFFEELLNSNTTILCTCFSWSVIISQILNDCIIWSVFYLGISFKVNVYKLFPLQLQGRIDNLDWWHWIVCASLGIFLKVKCAQAVLFLLCMFSVEHYICLLNVLYWYGIFVFFKLMFNRQ